MYKNNIDKIRLNGAICTNQSTNKILNIIIACNMFAWTFLYFMMHYRQYWVIACTLLWFFSCYEGNNKASGIREHIFLKNSCGALRKYMIQYLVYHLLKVYKMDINISPLWQLNSTAHIA